MTTTSFRLFFGGVALLAFVWLAPVSLRALPDHTGYVTDLASILGDSVKQSIETRIRDVETQTTVEIAVATVPSLEGMSVEEYGNRLFRQWGIGKKGRDNGVLILVAPTERKIRIEVGYGLEPILPDGLAGDIIRNQALPAFRDGNFAGGITATVDRVASIIVANHTVTPAERQALESAQQDGPSTYMTTPFFGLFIALGALAVGVGLRTHTLFPIIWGSGFGGIPFVMALIPFFNASLMVLVPLAAGMFALGWVKGGSESWRKTTRGAGRRGRKGAAALSGSGDSEPWVMGAGSSPSDGGSSSSSSSDSFGGGSSGGGGASGSW